jgi:hypothetical protein
MTAWSDCRFDRSRFWFRKAAVRDRQQRVAVDRECRRIGADWAKPARTGHSMDGIASAKADLHKLAFPHLNKGVVAPALASYLISYSSQSLVPTNLSRELGTS